MVLLVEWRVPVDPMIRNEGPQVLVVLLERPLPSPRVVSMLPPGVDGFEDPPGGTILMVPLTIHLLEVEEDPDQLDVPCPREPLEEMRC